MVIRNDITVVPDRKTGPVPVSPTIITVAETSLSIALSLSCAKFPVRRTGLILGVSDSGDGAGFSWKDPGSVSYGSSGDKLVPRYAPPNALPYK